MYPQILVERQEKRHQIDRINHLRRWAGIQCKNMPAEHKMICGKHPMLSLMGKELMKAWNNPKIICIERSFEDSYNSMQKVPWCWHPSAAKYAFALLEETRETFFAQDKPPLLRIQYEAMKTEPKQTITALCEFLQHTPTSEQRQKAKTLIRETNDDYCFIQHSV